MSYKAKILPIIISPDPRLKQKSEPVTNITDEIKQLMDDMLATMYNANGIGLAAIQVGVAKRIVVMDLEQEEAGKAGNPLKLINPEIISCSDEISVFEEGCLSFPGQTSEVERPERVKIRYMNETGAHHEMDVDGLFATCIQHEIDHLNGVTFVDHISRLKREMIIKRVKKMRRQKQLSSEIYDVGDDI